MIPRFGEPVAAGIRYRERQGAYVLLLRDGLVLLTRQSEPKPEFQLPGGGIDAGETPLRALHREALEETGWTIRVLRQIGIYRRFTYMPEYDMWARKTCRVYFGRPVMRVGLPGETGHTAHWVPPELAIELLESSGDSSIAIEFLQNSMAWYSSGFACGIL